MCEDVAVDHHQALEGRYDEAQCIVWRRAVEWNGVTPVLELGLGLGLGWDGVAPATHRTQGVQVIYDGMFMGYCCASD